MPVPKVKDRRVTYPLYIILEDRKGYFHENDVPMIGTMPQIGSLARAMLKHSPPNIVSVLMYHSYCYDCETVTCTNEDHDHAAATQFDYAVKFNREKAA